MLPVSRNLIEDEKDGAKNTVYISQSRNDKVAYWAGGRVLLNIGKEGLMLARGTTYTMII